ncbi:hypothetical protein PHYPSEUDO_009661 [Phytophthora pseudosyringae]|uniref:Uncharacterized protein n=1 Tax=Phytophthora pseudosyringae TaxID=221518 RepID=A0A8T1W8Z5_9STRA|nr:hypothetical protein PHYPSEUDO_009661 [Phytophthora pseudosyringae]
MGRASIAQVQQDVPGNGSREVFQGLFKDLGKQAMALEAILRAVCGRVDKMENWLTEVSFGMTELDQKLRNIAHNIDGTAAVDDETQGPQRWAIPPADDVNPLAPTVSKKLGTDKKAVRVTGMTAAILDRLATASTPTAAESDKSSVKKKSKDKKHSTKKAKASGSTELPPTPSLPAVAEISPPAEPKQTVAPVSAPPMPVPVVSVPAELVTKPEVPVNKPSPPEPVAAPRVETIEAAQAKVVAPVSSPDLDEAPSVIDLQPVTNEEVEQVAEAPSESDPPAVITKHQSLDSEEEETTVHAVDSEPLNGQSNSLSCENSPIVSAREETGTNALVEEDPTPSEFKQEAPMEAAPRSSVPVDEITKNVASPSVASEPKVLATESQPAQSSSPIVAMQAAAVEIVSTPSKPPATEPESRTPPHVQQPRAKAPAAPTPSVSSVLPTVQFERPAEPFVLKTSAYSPPSPPDNSPKVTTGASVIQTTPMQATPTESVPVSAPSVNKMVAESAMTLEQNVPHNAPPPAAESKVAAVHEPVVAVTKAIKASGVPIRMATTQHEALSPQNTVDTADPLLRATVRRRSSKMVPRPSFTKKHEADTENDLARRFSGNKRGSQSRRASVSAQAKVTEPETRQYVQQPAPLTSPVPQVPQSAPIPTPDVPKPPPISTPTISTEPEDIEEGGEGSESDSSSGESGSSNDDEEEFDDDTEVEAAAQEISKTMTALKKLKRAHMLSPEEEKELKDRAHTKWFQLKGHIKEKQKKDVTNILLKRKKNVFTVSSRIELLEEKSREIFAALKQITNEMREKNDRATHETLRRRVADIEQSLLTIDLRIASLSAPAIEKVSDLEAEVVSLRTAVQMQLTTAQSEAASRYSLLEEALARQRALVEALAQDVPAQLTTQTELFLEKLKQLPDLTAAIENLRRGLKRKADLKLLKELEARLLGLDAENEDCLVRCLSCHKEVINPYSEKDAEGDEHDGGTGGGASQLRKVNPGPSSARIYRSNIPFSAQSLAQESIQEEASDEAQYASHQTLMQAPSNLFAMADPQPYQPVQSAGDSHVSEKPPVVRVPSAKWSTPTVESSMKRDTKVPQASPLSLMNITAKRAILSPDRPISAPAVPLKKKSASAARSKSLLKSLTPQPDPPQ